MLCMTSWKLVFPDETVEVDNTIGLFREDKGFDVEVLDSTSRERTSTKVGFSTLVSRRRGDTFPYVFYSVGDDLTIKANNPTNPIQVDTSDEEMELHDGSTIDISQRAVCRIADFEFEVKPK